MKLGLALGGGSAKGYAHLGILKTLTDEGIEFDVIAGTSIGAFIGAVYAGGGLEKLIEISHGIKLKDLPKILSPAFSIKGLLSGNYINKLLEQVLIQKKIEDLPKPFAAISVDLNKGKLITFTSGNINEAIRASIAIPGLFTPVIKDDMFLVDGGVMDPVPIEAAKKLGADKVIAVDLISEYKIFSEDLGTKRILKDLPFHSELEFIGEYLKGLGESLYIYNSKNQQKLKGKTIFDIIQRISIVTQSKLVEYDLELNPPDILIKPDVSDIGILDFHKGKEGLEIGKDAVKKVLPEIKKLINSW